MPYIDYQFYTDEFKGVSLSEDAFNNLVSRASDLIDQVTNFKIETIGFENLYPAYQQRVKKAVAAQVEYMHVNGGIVNMQTADLSSASLGSFSYAENGSSGQVMKTTSKSAIDYLRGTGLLYSGVMTCG